MIIGAKVLSSPELAREIADPPARLGKKMISLWYDADHPNAARRPVNLSPSAHLARKSNETLTKFARAIAGILTALWLCAKSTKFKVYEAIEYRFDAFHEIHDLGESGGNLFERRRSKP